ncbi:hypothetical protein [Alkalisalibacterium limincola]|uniref:Polysaccharide deacetylase family protein n=1 Tax=Alkalisalibacterium limincola TaxID=2699169 RepID=A0A5C8KXS9_9GAMM|nr:hypothetical protein [Alkalisalibacterium limincola]TXK65577.1 hypothetical protein FU658_00085 [Alkalisalibacterium limincola]
MTPQSLKERGLWLYSNLRGWRTRRKLVVFESDDWGAIRMPSRSAYNALLTAGIRVDRSPYDRLDCLENRSDFDALMNVIDAHRDANGRPAVFTFNTILGNPDFDAIERDDFQRFHHQHLWDSYQHYHGESMADSWRQAMEQGLIRPQFHGREHLNVPRWMSDLRHERLETRIAFQYRFYGLTTSTSSPRQRDYLAAFWAENPDEVEDARSRLKAGLDLFGQTFGFGSKTFIPCNYTFPDQLRMTLADSGVRLIQAQRGQYVPAGDRPEGRVRRYYTGMKSPEGLLYSVRNVSFEPFESQNVDWLASTLRGVQEAFAVGKPAIVSTHRVNYVSGMDRVHAARSVRLLDELLENIRRLWPSVEFLSSDDLLTQMESS